MVAAALLAGLAAGPAAQERLPLFDGHVHYNRAAWQQIPLPQVLAALDAAGVRWALVSSSPDDGTLKLAAAAPDRVVPELRPYHGDVTAGNWTTRPDVVPYLEARLAKRRYAGIGEVHIWSPDQVAGDTVRRTVALALRHAIPLHVHSDAAVVRALLEMAPKLVILWAHAGMSEPPRVVGAMLDAHPTLMAELSFREGDIGAGESVDAAWRDLLVRHKDRFVIGSDTYVASRWPDYQNLIADHRAYLRTLPPEVARAIAYGNGLRLFGLDPPQEPVQGSKPPSP